MVLSPGPHRRNRRRTATLRVGGRGRGCRTRKMATGRRSVRLPVAGKDLLGPGCGSAERLVEVATAVPPSVTFAVRDEEAPVGDPARRLVAPGQAPGERKIAADRFGDRVEA